MRVITNAKRYTKRGWVGIALDARVRLGLAMDDLNYCTHCWEVDVSVDDGLCSECYKAAEEARLELEKHENDACEECTRRTEMLYICARCLCVQDRASMSNTKCKHTDKFVPACKNCKCKVFLT